MAAVDIDGNVWTWLMESVPNKIKGITNVKQVVGGTSHFLALTDNQVFAWGDNRLGQLGINQTIKFVQNPTPLPKPIDVFLNGMQMELNTPPLVTLTNTLLVPLRGVFENMGVDVLWDVKKKTVMASNKTTTIILEIGSNVGTVNGKPIKLAQSPIIVSNSVFVPLRFISESLGAKVVWDATEYVVKISTDN